MQQPRETLEASFVFFKSDNMTKMLSKIWNREKLILKNMSS